MPYSTGFMFFSEYHNAYLLVCFSNRADSTFRVSYAPSPVGPWTTDDKVLHTVGHDQVDMTMAASRIHSITNRRQCSVAPLFVPGHHVYVYKSG
ncbi:hypothetical protein V1507DRAFT_464708 [Lipomyces tetrasporus]